jgi:hypothetical protein
VVTKRVPVLWILRDVDADFGKGIATVADCEVVSLGEDINAVRERALSPDMLLEGRRSGAAAVDLPGFRV